MEKLWTNFNVKVKGAFHNLKKKNTPCIFSTIELGSCSKLKLQVNKIQTSIVTSQFSLNLFRCPKIIRNIYRKQIVFPILEAEQASTKGSHKKNIMYPNAT